MKQLVKKGLVGLWQLPVFNPMRRKVRAGKVGILLYHRITPDEMDLQLTHLCKTQTIIPLKRYVDAVTGASAKPLPENALVITFDDGWRSNFDLMPV